jgi:hypothetical protein
MLPRLPNRLEALTSSGVSRVSAGWGKLPTSRLPAADGQATNKLSRTRQVLAMLKDWADIAQSASVILASLFAIYGIDAWRREFIGKRRMELAEEVLALFYQARDVIESIRSPMGYVGEGQTRKPSPNERPEDKEALDRAFVLVERYNEHIEIFSRIHVLRYRFMAQLGVDAAKPFSELNSIVNELRLSSRRMARLLTRRERSVRSESGVEKDQREMEKVDAIYYSDSENDPIAPRVDSVVVQIEGTCKHIIESRGTLFSLFNRRL